MYRVNHLVPQQMFSTETAEVQGISAVKALAIASQQGQKIWTINQSNLDLALSRINLGADAENDIRNAVYAGKVATAHEARINFNGWIGEGYTLIDPNTGTGAYMISGGGNGGMLPLLSGFGLGAAFAAILGLFVALTGPLAVITLLVGVAIIVSVATYNLSFWSAEQDACFWPGFGLGTALTGGALLLLDLFALIALRKSGSLVVVQYIDSLIKGIVSTLVGAVVSAVTTVPSSNTSPSCVGL